MPSVDPALSIDARRQFLRALRRVLRPIVRLMIRHGVGYAEFADVARGAFVESAIRDAVSDGAGPTREQIARITGISRQRVDHYIDDEDAIPKAIPTSTRAIVEVLHRWHTDPQFLSPYGGPLELELKSASGPCLESLVAQIDPAASPAIVLSELLRTGSAAFSDERHIRALSRYFMCKGEDTHSIEYFGESLEHLTSTMEYNFNPINAENKRIERCVFADRGLPEKLLPDFQAHVQERANQLLLDLDDWLANYSDADMHHSGCRMDTGVNVFMYVEPTTDDRPLSSGVQPPREALPHDRNLAP